MIYTCRFNSPNTVLSVWTRQIKFSTARKLSPLDHHRDTARCSSKTSTNTKKTQYRSCDVFTIKQLLDHRDTARCNSETSANRKNLTSYRSCDGYIIIGQLLDRRDIQKLQQTERKLCIEAAMDSSSSNSYQIIQIWQDAIQKLQQTERKLRIEAAMDSSSSNSYQIIEIWQDAIQKLQQTERKLSIEAAMDLSQNSYQIIKIRQDAIQKLQQKENFIQKLRWIHHYRKITRSQRYGKMQFRNFNKQKGN